MIERYDAESVKETAQILLGTIGNTLEEFARVEETAAIALEEIDDSSLESLRKELIKATNAYARAIYKRAVANDMYRSAYNEAYLEGVTKHSRASDAKVYAEEKTAELRRLVELYEATAKALSHKISGLQTTIKSHIEEAKASAVSEDVNTNGNNDFVDPF